MTEQALTVQTQNSSVAPRYISIFEDPDAFGKKMQIAEALSRTQFVPEAFRGRAEDCLVALDMAARLELNPLAVFPDLYVIDNRASFSSKFLIALVNRSGRFTRIEYDEGVDGEADVTFTDWGANKGEKKKTRGKLPNYYATASFTELASGRSFSSPRIDVRFAEKNGWVEKMGSKWRSMPELMVRYRSAAILIRTVCPEIVMGLEWAEDLEDAASSGSQYAPERVIEIESVSGADYRPASLGGRPLPTGGLAAQATNGSEYDRPTARLARDASPGSGPALKKKLREAANEDELRAIAREIADAGLSDHDRDELRKAYAERRSELAAGFSTVRATTGSRPVETDAVALRPEVPHRKRPTGAAGEEVLSELSLMNAIKLATNEDALQRTRESIELSLEEGTLDESVANRLFSAIDARAGELAGDQDSGTEQQKTYARNLADAIKEAAKQGDEELLAKQLENVASWAGDGWITLKQREELTALAEAKKKELAAKRSASE